MARVITIPARVTSKGAEAVDSMRGGWSRSEYVRQALAMAVKNGLRGPRKVDL